LPRGFSAGCPPSQRRAPPLVFTTPCRRAFFLHGIFFPCRNLFLPPLLSILFCSQISPRGVIFFFPFGFFIFFSRNFLFFVGPVSPVVFLEDLLAGGPFRCQVGSKVPVFPATAPPRCPFLSRRLPFFFRFRWVVLSPLPPLFFADRKFFFCVSCTRSWWSPSFSR